MYLSDLDVIAVTLAIILPLTLVFTSVIANARLTRERDYWRQIALYDNRTEAQR